MAKATMKDVDKLIDEIKKKQALVIRRDVATLKRSYEMGKKIGRLGDEPFLTSFLAVCVGAFSGRKRKNLKKFFEGQFGPEVMDEVELLVESYDFMDGNDSLMENEIDVMIGFEKIILDTISFVDGLDSPDGHNRLTLSQLNEETKRLVKGKEKVVSSDPKEVQVKRFFNLYTKFLEKLKEFEITSPDRINHFMIKMTEMVQSIQVKRKEAGVVKPKVKKPSTVKKKAGSPVGMKLQELLECVDG